MPSIGRYCNGDPFVKNLVAGPGIKFTAITPASADVSGRWTNGVTADPGEGFSGYSNINQGWDSYTSPSGPNMPYVAGLNADPGKTGVPLEFPAGTEGSIVKVTSKAVPEATFGRDRLTFGGVVTVCAVEPPTNAFRPGISAPPKISHWTEDDLIDLTTLRNLTAPASMPPLDQLLAAHRWPVQSWSTANDPGWHLTPTGNHAGYGSDFARSLSDAILCLSLNITATEKRNLAVALVQRGIDIFERVKGGGNFNNGGGGHSAKKLPLAVAAYLLNDTEMQSYLGPTPAKFVEDHQYRLIDATDVATYGYPAGDLGGPDWKIDPGGLPPDPSTGANYRNVNLRWQIGASVGLQLLGAKTVYNNGVFFDYTDRIMERTFNNGSGTNKWATTLTGTNSPPQFHRDMWTNFRSAAGMPAIWNW